MEKTSNLLNNQKYITSNMMKSQIKQIFEASNVNKHEKKENIYRYDFNVIDFKNYISIHILKNSKNYTEIKEKTDQFWVYSLITFIWIMPIILFLVFLIWERVVWVWILIFIIAIFLNVDNIDKFDKIIQIDNEFWKLTDMVVYYPIKSNNKYIPLKNNKIIYSYWDKITLYTWKDIIMNDFFITKI